MGNYIILDKDIAELENLIGSIEGILKVSPNGTVSVHQKKNGSQTWISLLDPRGTKSSPYEIYVSKSNMGLFQKCIQKKYCLMLKKQLQKEMQALQTFQKNYNPREKYEVINEFPDELKRLIDPICKRKEEMYAEWESAAYKSNPYPFSGDVEFYTKRGERVRSKTEVIGGDALLELKIPYRYECCLVINGKTYYPDFMVIRKRDGKIFFIEFFGMMDNPDYVAKTMRKMNIYNKSEYAGQFIYIFESKDVPLNVAAVKKLLSKILL